MGNRSGKLCTQAASVLLASSAITAIFPFVEAALPLRVFEARANSDLDRKYALESVGILKSWDNVDGLFADYVSAAYRDYFSRQSRFVLQDLSKGDNILTNSKIPYYKLIQDPEVLGQLARSTRSQSIVRTKIRKEGPQFRFDIEWLHSPDMEIMSRETFTLQEPRSGEGFGAAELKAKLESALDRAIRKVPFVASVTGRDNASVTVNVGSTGGMEPGDVLQIGTIEKVKRHPLLKEVVEWDLANTGKIKIEQVEDRIAFGKILEEEPDHQIMRQQKVLSVTHAAPESQIKVETEERRESVLEEPPHLGWVDVGMNLGGFNRNYTAQNNSIGKDGGGFAFGVKADGQLWLTRDWFAELGFNFAYFPYSQKDTLAGFPDTSTSLGSGNLLGFKIDGGYAYHLTDDLFGPQGWIKLGYRSNAYSLPSSAADALAPITFRSLFVGLGGEVPIRDGFGATLDFGIGVINGASETSQLSGNTNSASDVSFSLGGYYRYTQRITFRATLDGQFNSADFATKRSLSQHVLTVVPAAVFFF
jgi:hypothetical protein